MRDGEHHLGVPYRRATELKKAVEFSRRWLDIGADDIEHADHDGSAPPTVSLNTTP